MAKWENLMRDPNNSGVCHSNILTIWKWKGEALEKIFNLRFSSPAKQVSYSNLHLALGPKIHKALLPLCLHFMTVCCLGLALLSTSVCFIDTYLSCMPSTSPATRTYVTYAIVGMYKSGAFISKRGWTGSSCSYLTDQSWRQERRKFSFPES